MQSMTSKNVLVAGVDEVGRGPLAGPVVAAAVVLPEGFTNPGIVDSKKLKASQRESAAEIIRKNALSWSLIAVGSRRIDKINIREATRLAMSLAVRRVSADRVLIDGNMPIHTELPQETVVKGDAKHIEIAAASILAKVYRDNLMKTLDEKYPGYNFSKHSGYPTKAHKAAVAELGPCPVHRVSFRGVKEFVS